MTPQQEPGFHGEFVVRALRFDENPAGASRTVQLWEVMQPLTFVSVNWGPLTVPAGMVTDFGSVPRMTKAIVDDDDPRFLRGFLIHDFLYWRAGNLGDGRLLTRIDADDVLCECARSDGAPAFKIFVVRAAVRIGGAAAWAKGRVAALIA